MRSAGSCGGGDASLRHARAKQLVPSGTGQAIFSRSEMDYKVFGQTPGPPLGTCKGTVSVGRRGAESQMSGHLPPR